MLHKNYLLILFKYSSYRNSDGSFSWGGLIYLEMKNGSPTGSQRSFYQEQPLGHSLQSVNIYISSNYSRQ